MIISTPLVERSVSFGEAAWFWARLGWVSFGGPAGQIALLHEELISRRRWLSERRFLHALNYCMLLPGPEAIQLATYLGWLMHGIRGGLLAGGLFLLPSVGVFLVLSSIYAIWGQLPLMAAVFWGLKPAVLAVVIQAAWKVGRRTLSTPFLGAIAAGAFLALAWWKVPYPLVVGVAALAGLLVGHLRPGWLGPARAQRRFGPSPAPHPGEGLTASLQSSVPVESIPFIHDDDTPTPAHARAFKSRLLLTLLSCGLALLLPLAALALLNGWHGVLATMARFFTRVALLSFGGAYAVLPYVTQGAVETFGWLRADQMIDGLALGETTPGPLIMVVAFVAFMGGWNLSNSLAFSALALLVAVWFTFLPSFAFILAGGPLVEASRDNLRLSAPLTAITAAVTGVIASLAALFMGPVLWPPQAGGALDGSALGILLVSLLLLLRCQWGVIPLIGAAALLGLLRLSLMGTALI
ncbi:MAG: chromate efflux transporter [Cyanobacteriota bacterium]|nr:chromate efflux transporter [Cyanobacteriota bacterium]